MSEPNGGKLEPNGGQGDGGTPSTSAQDREYELLGDIVVLSFTASPATVVPFGSATLAWSVELPTHLEVPVEIGVLEQLTYGKSGTATVAPDATTEYTLIAKTAIVERALTSTVTVTVNQSACVSGQFDTAYITSQIETAAENTVDTGGSSFSLGSAGISVTIDSVNGNQIDIKIPLVLDVPDWFNASMDIAIQLQIVQQGVAPHAALSTPLTSVNAPVSWTWYGNLLSLGITELVADGMQQVALAFLTAIAGQQANALATNLDQNVIQPAIQAAQKNDPEHRQFVLTVLGFDLNNLYWTLCPLPIEAPPSPAPPPPVAGGGPPPVISG